MGQGMKDTGKTIYNMVMGRKYGLTILNMKENIMRKMMNTTKRNLKLKLMSQEEQNLILPNLSLRIKEPYIQNLARNRSY